MSTTIAAKTGLRTTASASSPTTSYQACTWPGHCLGAVCKTNDDCDNDWICANAKCSPCCEGSPETIDTSASTSRTTTQRIASTSSPVPASSTASTATTHKGFSKGAAIGVGTAIAVVVALALGCALWVWHTRRRRKHAIWEAPANEIVRSRSDTRSPLADDQKLLFAHGSRGELPCPEDPAELSAVELVELEGNLGPMAKDFDEMSKPPLPSEPTTLRQRHHFEEYEISPAAGTQGMWTLSPVSNPAHQPTYEPSGSTKT